MCLSDPSTGNYSGGLPVEEVVGWEFIQAV
jgi:hypothetical protein